MGKPDTEAMREDFHRLTQFLKVKNRGFRECLGEFMGTLILVVFITAAGMQQVLSYTEYPLVAYIGSAMGVMMAFYTCGGVSGGAFNPAISLALCLTGKRPWSVFLWHCFGQMVGAFFGAALVYSVYTEALDEFDGGDRYLLGPNGTAAIFCSFPQRYLSTSQGFSDSLLASGLLIFCALAIVDPKNNGVVPWFYATGIGLLVLGILCCFSLNGGAPINPAKDLGPRLFILWAGWGTETFSFRDYNWFWIPVVGPMVGSIVGCFLYWLLIENHHPDSDDNEGNAAINHHEMMSIPPGTPSERPTTPSLASYPLHGPGKINRGYNTMSDNR